MKLEHTQGPWQVLPEEEGVPYIRIRGTVIGARYKIANVHMETYESVGEAWNEKEKWESRANARLIAAAPEMLEALCELLEQEYPQRSWNAEHIDYEISMGNGAAPLVKRVRAIITKATGGPT